MRQDGPVDHRAIVIPQSTSADVFIVLDGNRASVPPILNGKVAQTGASMRCTDGLAMAQQSSHPQMLAQFGHNFAEIGQFWPSLAKLCFGQDSATCDQIWSTLPNLSPIRVIVGRSLAKLLPNTWPTCGNGTDIHPPGAARSRRRCSRGNRSSGSRPGPWRQHSFKSEPGGALFRNYGRLSLRTSGRLQSGLRPDGYAAVAQFVFLVDADFGQNRANSGVEPTPGRVLPKWGRDRPNSAGFEPNLPQFETNATDVGQLVPASANFGGFRPMLDQHAAISTRFGPAPTNLGPNGAAQYFGPYLGPMWFALG